jgi:RHS repeat-associated protein
MSIGGTIGGLTESASYTYDNYGRLVTSNQTSNGSSAQRRFAYDRWANRSSAWDATSGGNQIQSVGLQTVSFPGTGSAPTNRITSVTSGSTLNYSYDANGNTTSDGLHSYTYDSENRVIKVDSGAAVYAYDHQNRRYKKTVGSSVTHYLWEGNQVVGEYNGSSGTVIVTYAYAGSRLIGKTGGSTQVLLSDPLSMRLALSDVGVVAGRQGHLPFGEDFAESGSQEKHHFTSYESDSESSTNYAVNRQYSQSVGRFMRVDPKAGSLGNPQSLGRYSYVANDPIQFTDPLGLFTYNGPIYFPGPGPWWPMSFFNFFAFFPPGAVVDTSPAIPVASIPTNIDIDPSLFDGFLTVDPNCGDSVLYVPEHNTYGKDHPELAWKDAAGVTSVAADFAATARGILKIPGGCNCSVSCTGGDDYRINCVCAYQDFGLVPGVLTDADMQKADKVADPRKVEAWGWVASRDRYVQTYDNLSNLWTLN